MWSLPASTVTRPSAGVVSGAVVSGAAVSGAGVAAVPEPPEQAASRLTDMASARPRTAIFLNCFIFILSYSWYPQM